MDPNLSRQLKTVTTLLQNGNLASAANKLTSLKAEHDQVGDVWALDGEIAIRQGRIEDALIPRIPLLPQEDAVKAARQRATRPSSSSSSSSSSRPSSSSSRPSWSSPASSSSSPRAYGEPPVWSGLKTVGGSTAMVMRISRTAKSSRVPSRVPQTVR